MSKTTRAQLIIDVSYEADDDGGAVAFKHIERQLDHAALFLASEGMLSGALDATVHEWHHSITEVPTLDVPKVRILVGASNAYACIQTPRSSMDIQLSGGKSAIDSLKQYLREVNQEIETRQNRIRHVEAAIAVLTQEDEAKRAAHE